MPLGIIQKGNSRTWFDDRFWWLTIIEFQPDPRRRGTYLNVGVHWLWHVKDYLSFDYGYRESEFATYLDDAQFTNAVERMISIATKRVQAYRDEFNTLEKASRRLDRRWMKDFWALFDAGIAAGMLGKQRSAVRLLKRVLAYPGEYTWIIEAQNSAQEWLALTDQPDAFRERAETIVRQARIKLGLPDQNRPAW